jgi:Hemolysin coregulated protein Hcp (TssD)
MASFHAELEISGTTYSVRSCYFEFTQATNERGRVMAKVRHGLVHLALDVPDDEALAAWGTAAHKPLAGHVTFFETGGRTARETLSWEAGECVGYHETFAAGDGPAGAYVCQLVIAAPKLVLTPGGPARPLAAATPRDYATAVAASPSPAALATLPELNKQQRYDARMGLMSNAQGRLAAMPDVSAQAALERLERNNVAVERARLSEHVYHSDEFELNALGQPTTLCTPEPEGWRMLAGEEMAKRGVSPQMLLDPKSGFKAALYESSFERPPKLVIAYAGTEDKMDIISDLRQGVGLKDAQYDRAMSLARTVIKNTDPIDVETTGHSLGGGLASAATVVTGTKGYTFNAAGLHTNTVKRPPYEVSRAAMHEQGALIDAYRSTSDPLNNAQKASVVTRGVVLPKALGVPHLVAPAKKWQHGWSELVKSNPLTAAKTMALHGHGISPQMVDHIEAEKDVDTATLTHFLNS